MRPTWSRTAILVSIALLLGIAGGFWVGLKMSSDHWVQGSHVLAVSRGVQAKRVLVYLDREEEGTVRWLMEGEIDSTLHYLETLNEDDRKQLADVYGRLKRYREEHPQGAEPWVPSHVREALEGATQQGVAADNPQEGQR